MAVVNDRATEYQERMEFSRRLRALMFARGLSIAGLMSVMGCNPHSRTMVTQWVSGRGTPSFESLHRLHAALGCTWEELMGA